MLRDGYGLNACNYETFGVLGCLSAFRLVMGLDRKWYLDNLGKVQLRGLKGLILVCFENRKVTGSIFWITLNKLREK